MDILGLETRAWSLLSPPLNTGMQNSGETRSHILLNCVWNGFVSNVNLMKLFLQDESQLIAEKFYCNIAKTYLCGLGC